MRIPEIPFLQGLKTKSLARRVAACAKNAKVKIAAMESCTGGNIAGALTDVPGGVFFHGIVAYHERAKIASGVNGDVLDQTDGPYSERAAAAMIDALMVSHGSENVIAVATTGVLNEPDRKFPHVPQGTAYIAIGANGETKVHKLSLPIRSRRGMKRRVVNEALALTLQALEKQNSNFLNLSANPIR